MAISTIRSDLQVDGQFTATSVTLPSACVGNAQVKTGDLIDHNKMEHLFPIQVPIGNSGTDVADVTRIAHIVRKAGSVVAVEVVAETAPTGGDKKFTLDVQKGSQSVAFATILSAVITYDNTRANKQVVAGTVTVPTLAAGDQLKIIADASGTTGSQAQNAMAVIWVKEDGD